VAISSWRASSAHEGHTRMSIASVKTRKATSSSWHLWHFSPILSDGEPLDISENLRGNPRSNDSRPFDGELRVRLRLTRSPAEPWLCPVEYHPRLTWAVSVERLLHRVAGISEHASPPIESLPFESLRAKGLSKRWVERRSCTGPFVVRPGGSRQVILGNCCFCSGFFFGSGFILHPLASNR